MFGPFLLVAAAFMAAYVFQRMDRLPLLGTVRDPVRLGLALAVWLFIAVSRAVGNVNFGPWSMAMETAGLTLLIVLFLTAVLLAGVDLLTGFGLFMPRLAPKLRGLAVIAGLVLSGVALAQGMRAPVITEYEVALPGLPKALDGLVVAAVSDLHAGTQLGPDWLGACADRIAALAPDMIVLLGDTVEGHSRRLDELLPALRRFRAPLGVFAVAGNHENHGPDAPEKSLKLLTEAGFTVLANRWASPAPGLVVAGVEDLATLRRRGLDADPLPTALANRPAGATILLSHTPLRYEQAASLGVGLMLSGHTHGGQVWPFNYVVRLLYPLVEGRFAIGSMTLIVSRGAGLWGVRMRLWKPGEILRITLRSK
ncbi:metallophosphoesterase [Pseudodesulfovibrio mercurii]|uniref:Metallophosphoesterase n=1 Tax=Pseudodesulfovibrio mercurii TaxID=641491 RepID=F0JID6_9BACT|nr:metallophosphoesterase [Pseudodesulfovibrio mercurii]EGB14188.1 metallophosphoesterase [Pseudodesulfovibrio mercurii]